MSKKTLEDLEGQKGVLRLLAHLYKSGETNFQRITDESEMYHRIVKSGAMHLKELGLVSTRIDNTSYPPKNMISLTEKGKKVAKHLKEIEEILAM